MNIANKRCESYYAKSINNYLSALPVFARALGKIHSVRTDDLYWEPIIGPWLLHFSSIYISRIDNTHSSVPGNNADQVDYSLATSPEKCYGWSQLITTFASDSFKDRLISQYRVIHSGSVIATSDVNNLHEEPQNKVLERVLQRVTSIMRRKAVILDGLITFLLFFLSQAIYRQNAILVDSSQLSLKLKIEIFRKSLGRIAPTPTVNIRDLKNYFKRKPGCDLAFRSRLKSLIDFPCDVEHRTFIEVALLNLPIVHLEDFDRIRKLAKQLFSSRPSVLYLSISHYFDEVLKCAIGEWSSQGTRLVVGQHGAGYGLYRFSTYEYFDLRSATVFLTWGWSDGTKKTAILPSIRLSIFVKHKYRCRKSHGYFMYVCSALPNFYGETFNFSPEDGYLKDRARTSFINECPKHLKKKICVRPYPVNSTAFGSYDVSIFEKAGFEIRDDESHYIAYSCAQLLIFEGLSTGFFEALAIDTPCVLYMPGIDNILWSDLGIDFESLIRRANILMKSERELISLLEQDVDSWFNSSEYVHCRKELVKRFALTSTKFIDEFVSKLLRVSAGKLHEHCDDSIVASIHNES